MKQIFPILLLFCSCSTNPNKAKNASSHQDTTIQKDISDSTNTLTDKIETLELSYIVWGCACANWITTSDFQKYRDSNLAKHCIFIEAANKELELPIYFDASRQRIKIEGQFYLKPDYPKGTVKTEEPLEKARVFRYTKIEVLQNTIEYPIKKRKTLSFIYAGTNCDCPEWVEKKDSIDTSYVQKIYLEKGKPYLLNADSLWNGNNIPIVIKVSGYYVSESGYPFGFIEKKEFCEPQKIFRYDKIQVIENGNNKIGIIKQ